MSAKTLAIIALLITAGPCANAAPLTLYLSPRGSDTAAGSITKPLATLDAARDRIVAVKRAGKLGSDGALVLLRGGDYRLSREFKLAAADDISPAPVTYAAYKGETAILDGGRPVDKWTRVADAAILARFDPAAREHVLQADLSKLGITDYGDLAPRGFGETSPLAPLELFFNSKPMTLAQWPNTGNWATIAGTKADQGADHFIYSGDRPSRWLRDPDVWLHGYWQYDWADKYVKVLGIDPATHQIRTAPQASDTQYTPKQRWQALNILEELDSPGEYYLDRTTGILYFWPPSDIRKGRAAVSLAGDLVSLDHISQVTLRGLTFQDCRGTALKITGGSHDTLVDCTMRNTGDNGVDIANGIANGLRGCEIVGIGGTGVELAGGDRKTLAPGKCFVENCKIHDFGRWDRTYHPAVAISGVGNVIAHNLLYDSPHSAILLSGNDHLIEYNEIHDVCLQTGDSGAFYMGRNWTMRGNMVMFNYFHDLGGASGLHGTTDVVGVYLDDTAAGTTVYGNLFVRAKHGVQIGGGRDNIVSNNIFVDCDPAVSLDARGLTWAAGDLAPGGAWHMRELLNAVPYDKPPYAIRYPHLANLLADNPGAPKYNVITHNIAYRCAKWLRLDNGEIALPGNTIADNFTTGDPQFENPAKGDYRLKSTSPALKLGFKPLPVEEMGITKQPRQGN